MYFRRVLFLLHFHSCECAKHDVSEVLTVDMTVGRVYYTSEMSGLGMTSFQEAWISGYKVQECKQI